MVGGVLGRGGECVVYALSDTEVFKHYRSQKSCKYAWNTQRLLYIAGLAPEPKRLVGKHAYVSQRARVPKRPTKKLYKLQVELCEKIETTFPHLCVGDLFGIHNVGYIGKRLVAIDTGPMSISL